MKKVNKVSGEPRDKTPWKIVNFESVNKTVLFSSRLASNPLLTNLKCRGNIEDVDVVTTSGRWRTTEYSLQASPTRALIVALITSLERRGRLLRRQAASMAEDPKRERLRLFKTTCLTEKQARVSSHTCFLVARSSGLLWRRIVFELNPFFTWRRSRSVEDKDDDDDKKEFLQPVSRVLLEEEEDKQTKDQALKNSSSPANFVLSVFFCNFSF